MARRRGPDVFLGFMTVFAALLVAVGIWEWVLSGALHNLFTGALTLVAVGLGAWLARRRRRVIARRD